jgi:hypothetical protein
VRRAGAASDNVFTPHNGRSQIDNDNATLARAFCTLTLDQGHIKLDLSEQADL